jgi:L-Ala-D/L-Glu epimerase
VLGGVGLGSPAQMAEEARRWIDGGFSGVQMKIGGFNLDPEKDVERVQAVRKAIGSGGILLADANQAYPTELAIRTLRRMERYEIHAEQPTAADDIAGLARVAKSVGVPILADESLSFGGTPIRNLMKIAESGAAEIIKLKDMPIGGIYMRMKIVRLAEELGMKIVMDTDGDGTRVDCTALAHVGAALNDDTFFPCLITSFTSLKPDVVKYGGIIIDEGTIKIPQEPGLGVEIDEKLLAQRD